MSPRVASASALRTGSPSIFVFLVFKQPSLRDLCVVKFTLVSEADVLLPVDPIVREWSTGQQGALWVVSEQTERARFILVPVIANVCSCVLVLDDTRFRTITPAGVRRIVRCLWTICATFVLSARRAEFSFWSVVCAFTLQVNVT